MRLPEQGDLPSIYLHPGELVICEEPTRVVTVLGSCVSVTMFSRRLKLGAICHGTMPRCKSLKQCTELCIDAFKFMDCAIRHMLTHFREFGILNRDIEIKVFGGADTLQSKSSNTIGSQNIKVTLDTLGREKLNVMAADVGDNFGRKLIFFSHTGDVYLKRLNKATYRYQP
ncbi:MAG: chemotaxis protein CheD [Nitrospirae bacterium]|nr:chemotaxis protein CheD [Nitrospirota bacterium]